MAATTRSYSGLYRTRFPGQPVSLCGAPEGLVVPGGAHGVWAAMAVLLDQPFGVVAGDEGPDGVTDLVDGLEDASVRHLLFQLALSGCGRGARWRRSSRAGRRRRSSAPCPRRRSASGR